MTGRENFEWLTRLDPVAVVVFYSMASFVVGLMLGLLLGMVFT